MRAALRTARAGPLDQRERQLAGVDVTVGGEVGGTQDPVDAHGRESLLSLSGGDELEG